VSLSLPQTWQEQHWLERPLQVKAQKWGQKKAQNQEPTQLRPLRAWGKTLLFCRCAAAIGPTTRPWKNQKSPKGWCDEYQSWGLL
jgi:hypothetical protein